MREETQIRYSPGLGLVTAHSCGETPVFFPKIILLFILNIMLDIICVYRFLFNNFRTFRTTLIQFYKNKARPNSRWFKYVFGMTGL